jgi:hypothetical protein
MIGRLVSFRKKQATFIDHRDPFVVDHRQTQTPSFSTQSVLRVGYGGNVGVIPSLFEDLFHTGDVSPFDSHRAVYKSYQNTSNAGVTLRAKPCVVIHRVDDTPMAATLDV